MFPKIVVPQMDGFIMENLIKIDDLGVPLFLETSIFVVFPWEMVFDPTEFSFLKNIRLYNSFQIGKSNAS